MPLDRAVQPDDAALLMQSDYAKAARTMQIAVAEYYNNFGKLPKSNADAGLPPPSEYRGDTLRSATIGADGSIEMVFDGKSGKQGGRVRLIPDLSHVAAMSVQWHCQSPDYPQIDHILRNCAYTGGESR